MQSYQTATLCSISGSANSAASTEEASPVNNAKFRLMEAINENDKLVEAVESRFANVLSPTGPIGGDIDNNNLKSPEILKSSHATDLEGVRKTLEKTNRRLSSILTRCEL